MRHTKCKLYLTASVMSLTVAVSACQKKKSGAQEDNQSKVNDVNGEVSAGTLALMISETLNIIPAKTTESVALVDVDDAKARVNYRVQERSTEGLMQAQGILCFLAQTKYTEMANLGPYIALVNESKCFKDGDSNSGAKITRTKVESVREEGKALQVKLWLAGKDEGETDMQVQLKVAEGSSEQNPIGIFRLDFDKGYLESRRNDAGEIEVYFFEDDQRQNESWKMQMAVRLNQNEAGDIIGGRMAVNSSNSWDNQQESSTFQVAFDDNFINRAGTANGEAASACLNRSIYTSRAWQYNIFKADGSLYKLNSGFPIEWDEGGAIKQGYASYWGVNANGGGSLPSSINSVRKVEYSGGNKTTTPFTLKKAPGKLYKNTKKQVTLGQLKGVELRQYSGEGTIIAKWNGTKFEKVATVEHVQNEGEKRTPAPGDISPDSWSNGFRFHVESLGGEIFIPESEVGNESFKVSYFQRTLASGTPDAPTGNLVCFDRCIEMSPLAEKFQENGWGGGASGPFKLFTGYNNTPSNTANNLSGDSITYTWDKSSHNLKQGATAFTLPTELSSSSGDNKSQGISHQTGALVPEAALSHISNKSISPYDLERMVDVYYTFETGTESYNQFIALIDANGSAFQFDQPVNFTYVHSQENDLNGAAESEYYGQTFSLQYGGSGNLWGFPSKKDPQTGYHYSLFGLKPGATLENGLVAVPVEVEQILSEVDAANCAGIAIENLPELPSTPAPAIDNGVTPADDTPVKVIDGVIL